MAPFGSMSEGCPECNDLVSKGIEAGKTLVNKFVKFVATMTGGNDVKTNSGEVTVKTDSEKNMAKIEAAGELGESLTNDAPKAAKAMTYQGLDMVDEVATNVSTAADAATVASGGATAPVTVPISNTADLVSATASVAKAGINLSENNVEGTINELTDATISLTTTATVNKTMNHINKTAKLTPKQNAVQEATIGQFIQIMLNNVIVPIAGF